MRIIFLTLVYPLTIDERNIYSDLMDEIASRGHEVIVFRPSEGMTMPLQGQRGEVRIRIVKTGKITKSHFLMKTINTLLLGPSFLIALRSMIAESKPDLILYSTPPITFVGAIRYLKRTSGCQSFLLLKDIFPANACDIGLMKRGGAVWRFFRRKEKKLYEVSDRIGCMSKANVEYLVKNNPGLEAYKVGVCPNSVIPTRESEIPPADATMLAKYGIPEKALKLVYGGNIGRPQCVRFIIEILKATQKDPSLAFVFVGDGTDYHFLEDYAREQKDGSIVLIRKLPKKDYLAILASMDVGLIFLDDRFTIPNYPSRILDYFDLSLPVLAATDTATDLRTLLEEERCGLWSKCGDTHKFLANIRRLKENKEERIEMGVRGRRTLFSRFNVNTSADFIVGRGTS